MATPSHDQPASIGRLVQPQPNNHYHDRSRFWSLTLGCAGVVYGDIGTSPLYAFREAMMAASRGGPVSPDALLGILSLILWALIIIVTLKYVLFLLRFNNHGEGGILSLMSLAHKGSVEHKKAKPFLLLAILGAALFYGDAAITPAISVLSAVEGLKLVTPTFEHMILPLSIGILITLFSFQQYGTSKVSALFGPVTVLWFLVMGFAGVINILDHTAVLNAFNPWYATHFLISHSNIAFVTLGAVFLAVTGAEALYADLGHFGRKPIQTAWLGLAFPCLTLNYLGQGALILNHPEAITNPFFLMVPEWGLLPLVLLATVATIIASQAVITGAYSLTRQAMQIGMLPRLDIRHTSSDQEGQIYMPKINHWLLVVVLLLCLIFGDSSSLASAYGISVTGTMVVTATLAFIVLRNVWKKPLWMSMAVVFPFMAIDLIFLSANLLKVMEGGFVTLFIAALLMLLMVIWTRGTRYLRVHALRQSVTMDELLEHIESSTPIWIEGTAIFMTSDSRHAPMALIKNLRHNKVMHKKNIILTVITEPIPYVLPIDSLTTATISPYMIAAKLRFGYMQTPNVPNALGRFAFKRGITADLKNATYFLGRRTIIPDARHGLPLWQANLYDSMNHSAATATNFYHLPVEQVVELGQQLVL